MIDAVPAIFLSASFPSGERAEAFAPFDPAGVADAVAAVSRAVLHRRWRLVFGGHPTITPVVLFIAGQEQCRDQVEVFQSRWFEDQITRETRQLADLGLGHIEWTARERTLEESLGSMRRRALASPGLVGSVFIGGMEGILEEFELSGALLRGRPRIPFGGPGGAAARILQESGGPEGLSREQLGSRRYPALADTVVRLLQRELPR